MISGGYNPIASHNVKIIDNVNDDVGLYFFNVKGTTTLGSAANALATSIVVASNTGAAVGMAKHILFAQGHRITRY